ncbi:MAG: phosphoribosylamine--glycine ligase [Chloroflexi bacterium]|nr:phosphoribosylamine--glycine ligase [Chloroflexota bacterium]
MRVLIVGGGGREHALAWTVRQSPRCTALFCAPGNAGTAALAENLPVAAMDLTGQVAAARAQRIDRVIVAPDDPLGAGLVDALTAAGIAAYGPTQAAARIESSKWWAKDVMRAAGVPTARAEVYDDAATALRALDGRRYPLVLKADGLAQGKGVLVATEPAAARAWVERLLVDGGLGLAGSRLLIEEYLAGREFSLFGLCDGETVLTTPAACDYKRLADGDAGPNTGGMGAYAPVPWIGPAEQADLTARILRPVLAEMARQGAPFRGVLYAGLIQTADGPQVIEFNCRWGDPEAEVLLPLLETDYLEIVEATLAGRLADLPVRWRPGACVAVGLASAGYPERPVAGDPIDGLAAAERAALVFHAGTRQDGPLVRTAGGRVVFVVGQGPDLAAARARAYAAAAEITFAGCQQRTDIAAQTQ